MILRIVLGRLAAGTDPGAVLAIRDRLTRAAAGVVGLDSLILGTRDSASGSSPADAAFVTVWRDVDSMARATDADEEGGLLGRRLQVPLVIDRADHYEIMGRTFAALPPESTTLMRILRVRARENQEGQLLEVLRDQQPRLTELGLVASHVGRRVVGRDVEAVSVGVWPDRQTVRAATGGGLERPLFAHELDPWSEDISLEMYDGVEIAPRLPTTVGPPIFVLDDELRVVDTTASAAATLGWTAEDLVGRSMLDLSATDRTIFDANHASLMARGEVIGEGATTVPDSGVVFLRFVARRDVPVEGRHTVLVRRMQEPAPTSADFDAAIAEAFPKDDRT